MRGMIWESHGLFGGIWKWNIKIAPLRRTTVFLWSAPSLHLPWKLWAVPAIPEGHGVLDLTLALCRPGVSAYGKLGKGCCISPSGFVKIKEISMLCQQEVSGQTGWGVLQGWGQRALPLSFTWLMFTAHYRPASPLSCWVGLEVQTATLDLGFNSLWTLHFSHHNHHRNKQKRWFHIRNKGPSLDSKILHFWLRGSPLGFWGF